MHHFATTLAALLLAAAAGAQDPKPDKPTDPAVLVSRAEQLCKKGEIEEAVLILWRALDELGGSPENPVRHAARLTAEFLLEQHDPREKDRRRVFDSIAKQQVELARAYKGRKWFDTAATRLDVADRYDKKQGAKERTALEAARPKPKSSDVEPPKPAEKKPTSNPLLQRANTEHASTGWQESGELLECAVHDGKEGVREWITKQGHSDHEVSIEFRPVEPTKGHNASLAFGSYVKTAGNYFVGFRAQCNYDPSNKSYSLDVFDMRAKLEGESLASVWLPATAPPGGFHRLSVQVRGKRLRVQLDEHAPLDVEVAVEVRGRVGLTVGISDTPACVTQFRNLRIDPLPADRPSDEELREQAAAALQQTIGTRVDEATKLLADKQPEAAALLLRQALEDVRELPAGLLRDNLAKSIEPMLAQADPLAPKRKKAAQGIAAELATLADQYATAGMARAAQALVVHAVNFDPEGQAKRLATAEEAVRAWNLAQATLRAADLAPPPDDGAVLREWFAEGRLLDSRQPKWTIDGPSARTDAIPPGELTAWMPKATAPKLTKARVHVRLPAKGTSAGFCFDAAGPHDYAIVFLQRAATGLNLMAFRYAGGRWTELKRARIPLDAWRLDAWFPIELELAPAGLTIRGAGAEFQLASKLLPNNNGRFGLYASNGTEEPATIELRAFQIVP